MFLTPFLQYMLLETVSTITRTLVKYMMVPTYRNPWAAKNDDENFLYMKICP